MRERDGTVVFVEVRSRRVSTHGGADGSVTLLKQPRIIFAARCWLARAASLPPCRFDVVSVEAGRIEWLRAAFNAG
jgi:putative endonuclease